MEDVSKVLAFLELSDDGYGYGYGDGSGCYDGGYDYDCIDGYGEGDDGYGDGSGGYDYDCIDGYGYGSSFGYGIRTYNGQAVYRVDGLNTLIDHIRGSRAKCRILKSDLTTEDCFIVKGERCFSHGKTLSEATRALVVKEMDAMPLEERLDAFVAAHPEIDVPYPNTDLFTWHNTLTGSCEMGRKAFVEDHGLSLDGSTTVREFIELTENAYGGEIIKQLKDRY